MDHGAIPEKFGDYLTLRDEKGAPVVLGSGGFGTTICAFRSRFLDGKEIRHDGAIKVLRNEAIRDPKRRRSFIEEIIALSELQHPNLVRYIDCGEQDGSIFMVMDLCRGGDLERLVKQLGPFSERAALQAVLQICAGLDEAHRKGFLHRDLKPRNVLLAEPFPADATMAWLEDGLARHSLRLKIVDFGLSGRLGTENSAGGFVGSPMFASPEQVRQRRDLDARSDLYSLGMSLWFLVTGHGPLLRADGNSIDDAKEAMRAHTSPIPHDIAFPSTLSPEFRQLLSRMVKKPREERFASLEELVRAIRVVLERVPGRTAAGELIAAPSRSSDLKPISLPRQPAWGRGKFGDYYEIVGEVGRRALGKLYRATLDERIENQFVAVPAHTEVRLTAWLSERKLDDPLEIDLAEYLCHVWALTWTALAPPSLARILEVRRTETEWCLAEEWLGGMPLEAAVAARGKDLTVAEAAALLMPVGEAADFLHQNRVDYALLDLEDIRLFHYDAEQRTAEWLSKPVSKWGNWGLQVSPLAVPNALTGHSPTAAHASTTISSGSAIDVSQLPFSKSFSRLVYRVLQRTEAAEAADWDLEAYDDCAKLGAASNQLLREYISGNGEFTSAVELLRTICKNEGVFEMIETAGASASRRSLVLTSRYIESSVSASTGESSIMDTVCLRELDEDGEPLLSPDAPTIIDPIKPVTRVGPPPAKYSSIAPAAGSSLTRVPSAPPPPPPPLPPPLPAIEIAEIVPDEPRTVRSPYGTKATQRIRGPEWRPGGSVACAETRRVFRLPESLPALEAVLIPGRCDTVLSPYQEPPGTMALPSAAWAPGAPISCAFTRLPLTMPRQLPDAIGAAIEARPGVVRSPFAGRAEITVSPDNWQPGAKLRDPAAVADFLLPATLPPLEAQPAAEPATFISPYAPGEPFTLPPFRCGPGTKIDCPKTGRPLVIPAALPPEWKFIAEVRQREEPEARSPFVEDDAEAWHALAPQEWRPGTRVSCHRSGRPFELPESLPILTVAPAEKPATVRSPFSPHKPIAIEPKNWHSGAEFDLSLVSESVARVRLVADDLPPLEALADPDLPGQFRSPFAPSDSFDIPPHACIPGALVECPKTQRPLRLPEKFPVAWRFEGAVRQADSPEARSPFVENEADAWQPLTPEQWRPRTTIKCRVSGRDFVLPEDLPILDVQVCEEHACICSPFAPHQNIAVRPDEWQPGAELTVHLPGGPNCRVRLPADARPITHATAAELDALPQAYEPQLQGQSPAIRSPHGAQALVEIPPAEWLPGRRRICPETKRAFWLPAELPPLTAALGASPGTIVSPFTSREIEIEPANWKPNAILTCPDTGGRTALPAQLPLLVAHVNPARPGEVVSPYAPDKPFALPFAQWVPKRELECPVTRRKFRLPDELPEWILEAELFNPAQALVRSPLGGREAFRVEGLNWMPGKIVTAPDGERLSLPRELPPLEAIIDQPGAIRSPYAPAAKPQRVLRANWRPGATVPCAATGRAIQLPQNLPPLPEPKTPRFAVIGGVAASFIVLAAAVVWFVSGHSKRITPTPPVLVDTNPTPGPAPVADPEWPKTFVFQDGTTPPPPAAVVRLVAGATTSDPLPAKVESGAVTVDLSPALTKRDFANAADLKLQLSAPGFAARSIDLKKVRSGRDFMLERVALRRETGELKLAGTNLPFYSQVHCTPTNGDAARDLILDLNKPQKVAAGSYKITLLSKDSRFAEKLVGANAAIEPGQPFTIELPPFPFPRVLAGLSRRETIGGSNRVFKSRNAAIRVPTINGEQFVFNVWSPELIVWDDASFTNGYLYETNTAALVAAIDALDNICYAALILSAEKAGKPFELAPDTKKISGLAEEFHDAVEQELTASAKDQRTRLRDAAKKIRGLMPANLRTVYPDEERQKYVTGWLEVTRIFIDQLSEGRDQSWTALLESARTGKAPAQSVLDKLSEPVAGLPGILVKNRLQTIGYNGESTLELKIDRYQGRAKPLNWLPTLEALGNGTFRLTDTTPGAETTIPLREAK